MLHLKGTVKINSMWFLELMYHLRFIVSAPETILVWQRMILLILSHMALIKNVIQDKRRDSLKHSSNGMHGDKKGG